jgi:pyridoxal phosphate enzyme (YggS family)
MRGDLPPPLTGGPGGPPAPSDASTASAIAPRLAEVRARIAEACARVGRDPAEVTLVGATKTVPPARIRAAVEAGLADVGENRVQELRAKHDEVPDVRWHFFGPLQAGSARHVAALADVVHTLAPGGGFDRLVARLADLDRTVDGLIEVDLTGERHGVSSDDLPGFAAEVASTPGVRLAGLMAIAPLDPDPEAARHAFARLRSLRDALRDDHPEVLALSMGMSLDYAVAVEEGATMVRVGTALFGARPRG